jgi:hypothetical protein
MKQLDLIQETIARDKALDLLEDHRGSLIDAAKSIAVSLARKNGKVTSTEVLEEMRNSWLKDAVSSVDRRFMGAVFRAGWERVGFTNSGSHRRPVSVWRLR